MLSDEHECYVVALEALNNVIEGIFSKSLSPYYRILIEEFNQALQALPIRISPKLHQIVDHLPNWLEKRSGQFGSTGLGPLRFYFNSKHIFFFKFRMFKLKF